MTSILFDRYVIPKGGIVPPYLSLKGAVGITQDLKRSTWLHKIFYLAQKTHCLFFRNNHDPYRAHWMLFIDKDETDPYRHYIAHSVFSGIKRIEKRYIDPKSTHSKDVTSLIIYIPRDSDVRNLLAHHAIITSYDAISTTFIPKNKGSFSIVDMIKSFFKKSSLFPPHRDRGKDLH